MPSIVMAELILIIDDDADVRGVVTQSLEPSFRVIDTDSEFEALQMMRRRKPGLILLDLVMPGVDTRALLSRLHRDSPAVPIVMLTADQDVGHAREMLEEGAVLYLTKPFEPRFLREEISRLLAKGPAVERPPWRLEPPEHS